MVYANISEPNMRPISLTGPNASQHLHVPLAVRLFESTLASAIYLPQHFVFVFSPPKAKQTRRLKIYFFKSLIRAKVLADPDQNLHH